MIKIQQLGLDFGSSATVVVGLPERNDTPVLFLPKNAACFYSAVTKADAEASKDKCYYFDDAFSAANEPGHTFHGSMKEDIYKETDIASWYLEKVLTQVRGTEDFDFSSLAALCYGYPEYYDAEEQKRYCDFMDDVLPGIVKAVFQKNDVKIFSYGEPLLAAVAFQKETNVLPQGELMLVLDLGGHTMDMALVKGKKDGVLTPIRSKSTEITPCGTGKEITEKICQTATLGGEETKPFDTGAERAKRALFAGRGGTIETLQYKEGAQISLTYDAKDHEILVKEEYQKEQRTRAVSMRDIYRWAAADVRKFLESAECEPQSIQYVLFTGGTSRISYLRGWIMESISDWLRSTVTVKQMDEESAAPVFLNARSSKRLPLTADTAVAYGAALLASMPCLLTRQCRAAQPPRERADLTKTMRTMLDNISVQLELAEAESDVSAARGYFQNAKGNIAQLKSLLKK